MAIGLDIWATIWRQHWGPKFEVPLGIKSFGVGKVWGKSGECTLPSLANQWVCM